METSKKWIRNPCFFNSDKRSDDGEQKEDLIQLHSNRALETQFDSKTLGEYWCSAMAMFLGLCETALVVLTPFTTYYLCESKFSTLLSIKPKSRNCLNTQADVPAVISNIVPRYEKLVNKKQEQSSS